MRIKLPDPDKALKSQDPATLLAMAVWAEARGEELKGQLAVCCVMLNRVQRAYRGKTTITEVILDPWQFSSFNENDSNLSKLAFPLRYGTQSEWERAIAVVELALDSCTVDPTQGSTHYCTKELWNRAADPLHPKWFDAEQIASSKTQQRAALGDHVFALAA